MQQPPSLDGSQFSAQQTVAYNQPVSTPTPVLHEPPVRPDVPFKQFTEHMRPQLEKDDYPAEQIEDRIQQEWANLSDENRLLWENRYRGQMQDYTDLMDKWKRQQRQHPGGSFSESRNRTVPPPPPAG